jgi:hypothetical protein
VAVLIAAAWLQAWDSYGSTLTVDWLAYAVLAALVLAVLVLSGAASRAHAAVLTGVLALFALAVWAALSVTWSPLPTRGRDEALLTAFYAVALAVTVVALRTRAQRLAAVALLVAGIAGLAVAIAIKLIVTGSDEDVFMFARLSYPISYANAQAAMLMVAFWPAIVLAAVRRFPLVLRGLAFGCAVAIVCAALLAQSKGSTLGLGVSAAVVFAWAPSRLRLLPPTLLAGGFVLAGFEPLTRPFRDKDDPAAFDAAIVHAGWSVLWLSGAAVAIGLVYASADRRLELPPRTVRLLGLAALAGFLAAVAGGLALFFARVDHPRDYFADRWTTFKHLPTANQGLSTHLLSLGSNRYDFWRVSLDGFRAHPVAGIGARGFWTYYIEHRRSEEMPTRAHSLPLDVLLEEGLVGFALLALGLGLPLAVVARRRDDPVAVAALAGSAYWLAHASVDWNWTVPAVGLPFLVLLGTGAAGETTVRLARPVTLAAGVAAIALAAGAFAPTWVSGRLTRRALFEPRNAQADLRRAERLDPLSVDPYLMASLLDPRPASRVRVLRKAVAKEPRRADLHYALQTAYGALGDKRAAARELATARRLDPWSLRK